MNNIVFNQILHLVGMGYTVNLSKDTERLPSQVLKIELSKGEFSHVETVDMATGKTLAIKNIAGVTVDYTIYKALLKAEDELEYKMTGGSANESE